MTAQRARAVRRRTRHGKLFNMAKNTLYLAFANSRITNEQRNAIDGFSVAADQYLKYQRTLIRKLEEAP
jgi:hypothetical protein